MSFVSPFWKKKWVNSNSSFKSRETLGDSSCGGWSFIQILTFLSAKKLNFLKNNFNISFNPNNYVEEGMFRMYLNKEQCKALKNTSEFNIFSAKKSNKRNSLGYEALEKDAKFIVMATEDWKPKSNAQIQHFSNNFFVVSNFSDSSLLDEISKDEKVLSVKKMSKRTALNRFKSGFLQSGEDFLSFHGSISENSRALAYMGIDGDGEIVNVADTGVDAHHTFFYDKDHDVAVNSENFEHRKIVRYDAWVDDKDCQKGHGSHVAGTLLGKADCENCGASLYNGVATGAKLYMTDLGSMSVQNDISGDFDLDQTVRIMNKLGSGISSNSWGFESEPGGVAYSYDKISEDNPNVSFVFAAGNERKHLTINSPASGKNVIAVGLVTNPSSNNIESERKIFVYSPGMKTKYELKDAAQYNYWYSTKSGDMKWIVNKKVVSYENDGDINDSLVLYYDNNFCDVFSSIEEKGAKGIIISQNKECNGRASIPVFYASTNVMDSIKSFGTASISFEKVKNSEIGVSNVGSLGPADSNLLKPDIVAPGINTMSAKSGSPTSSFKTDDIFGETGTSMATPAIAGVLTLIRQFFTQGWYKSIKKNSCEPINPTSSLLRAMLINSAEPIGGVVPDVVFGFGLPKLVNVLPINGNFGLRILNQETIKSKEHHVYKFHVERSGRLCVTMSYIDLATDDSNMQPIFCDIDLVVKAPNGKLYYGNQYENKQTEHFSTNERVLLNGNDVVAGDWEIHVLSNEYTIDVAPIYSIVVTAPFDHQDLEKNPLFLTSKNATTCFSDCNKGKCVDGQCKCNDDYYGINCDEEFIKVNDSRNFELEMTNREIYTFKYPVEGTNAENPFTFTSSNTPPNKAKMCFQFGEYKGFGRDQICREQFRSSEKVIFPFDDFKYVRNGVSAFVTFYLVGGSDATMSVRVTPLDDPPEEKLFSERTKMIGLAISGVVLLVSAVTLITILIRHCCQNKAYTDDDNLTDKLEP